MLKYFFVTVGVLVIVGAGCTTKTNIPATSKQKENTETKVINWCDDKKTGDNELWISSEYYNGMNHAPTIRHVCQGNKEIFYLEMVWDDSATAHTGSLISKKSGSLLPISSKLKDPEFVLTLNQDQNTVRFTVDKKIFMYNVDSGKFTENL